MHVAVLLVLSCVAAAPHNTRAHRSPRHIPRNVTHLAKRFTGKATHYTAGLGACGIWNTDSDYIVALNAPQYGDGYPGPNCFKRITVQAEGKTVSGVQITDKCPGCDYGDLDMSDGLFTYFAELDQGVIHGINWWYEGEGASAPPADPAPAPEPSQAPVAEWTAASSQAAESAKPTESSAESTQAGESSATSTQVATSQPTESSTTSTPSSTASSSSTRASSPSASATQSPDVLSHIAVNGPEEDIDGNLGGIMAVFVRFGNLLVAGGSV